MIEAVSIQDGTHISAKHTIKGVSQLSYNVDVHTDDSLNCRDAYHCTQMCEMANGRN